MKAQNYRTTTQANSGHAGTGRRRTNSGAGSVSRPRKASKKNSSSSKNGARVIMMLMTVGGVIAVGFILAQHSLINTLQFKRAEENLKSELDTLSSQQRFYTFKKEQALSTQESDRAASESGLVQPGLGRAVAQQIQPEAANKSQAKNETQSNQPKAVLSGQSSGLMTSRLVTKASDKQNGQIKQPGKTAPQKKQPEHKSNAVTVAKVVKVENKANSAAKPEKTKKDSRQIAKNQKPPKEVKRQR